MYSYWCYKHIVNDILKFKHPPPSEKRVWPAIPATLGAQNLYVITLEDKMILNFRLFKIYFRIWRVFKTRGLGIAFAIYV